VTGFTDTDPLGDAREWLREAANKGAKCPCCTQRAQVYRRTITSTMARSLVHCYRTAGVDTLFHLPTVLNGDPVTYGSDTAKLAYWRLMAEEPRTRDDGGRAGWWTVTSDGSAFIHGYLNVAKYARVYDGRCLGFEGEPVSITQCLGKRFNLEALLEGRQ